MSYWFSFLFPWLLVMALLQWVSIRPSQAGEGLKGTWRRSTAIGAIALLANFLPVWGLPLGRWLEGLNFHASIPLLALLAGQIWKRAGGSEILRESERNLAWGFGAVAGTLLYPLALGLGRLDPYSWGWSPGLLFPMAALGAMVLIWRRNRVGWVLLFSMLAYDARCLESINFWDYLVDPVYWLLGVVMIARLIVQKIRRSASATPIESKTSVTHVCQ